MVEGNFYLLQVTHMQAQFQIGIETETNTLLFFLCRQSLGVDIRQI